ncbi:MAG: SulP family inorganic anion transporter [Planctomyces sp.]|nr:SulP family inorganic anion transporter [Planctomyces sp.]
MANPHPASGWTQDLISNVKNDLPASLVVFLIALPLSIGIAVASGVPEEQAATVGLVTAVIGGIVVGMFAGCPLQVSGPAAGLIVLVAQIISEAGLEQLGPIVCLAGLIQIIAARLGLGRWFRAISPAVIEGMLAGIGILIFASQFHMMVDDLPPGTGKHFGGIVNLVTIPNAVWKGLTSLEHRGPAILGLAAIITILTWEFFRPRRFRIVPASLLGVIVATLVDQAFNIHAKSIAPPTHIWSHFVPRFDGWGAALISVEAWLFAVTVAVIASAESLITATAIDSMQNRAARTRHNRELFAQGMGNTCAGLVGVLPITGVVVRGSANVMTGATSRASTIMHGLWILLFVAVIPGVLRLIPSAALAAILVYTGIRLASPATFIKLWKEDRGEFFVGLMTMLIVFGVDLLTGIIAGLVLACVRLLYVFSKLRIDTILDADNRRATIVLNGAATFVRLPDLEDALKSIPKDYSLHVNAENVTYMDHAALKLLLHWGQLNAGQYQFTGPAMTSPQPPTRRAG